MFFLQLKPGSHWDLLMHFFLISWGSATGLQNGLQQPILKLGLLSISDCISDFKVRHKKKISILSRPIARFAIF